MRILRCHKNKIIKKTKILKTIRQSGKTKRINGLKGPTGREKKRTKDEARRRGGQGGPSDRTELANGMEVKWRRVAAAAVTRGKKRAERKSSTGTGDGSRSPLMDVARRTARPRACARPYKAPEGGQSDGRHRVFQVFATRPPLLA